MAKNEMTIGPYTEADLPKVATELLKSCRNRKIFGIYGTLGVGKTALVRALCTVLGIQDKTSSPTFAIANEYQGDIRVFHLDLYRLESAEEAVDAGVLDYLDSGHYCFVEWPELIEQYMPEAHVRVHIEVMDDLRRKVKLTLHG